MFYSCCKTMLLIFLGFTVAINVEAKDTTNIIMCPELSKIHEAASLMNHVECKQKSCTVSTDKLAFYENGLYWMLDIGGITASSESEAMMKAQNIAAGVTVMFSDIAMGPLCIYYVGSFDQSADEMIGMVAWGSDNTNHISRMPTLLRN